MALDSSDIMALTVAVMGALGGYYLYNKTQTGGRKSRRSRRSNNRSKKSRK